MFNKNQIELLERPLSADSVKGRRQGNRQVSYIESWHAIAEANRIFGYGNWSSITSDLTLRSEKEGTMKSGPGWFVTYTAKVRVIIHSDAPVDAGSLTNQPMGSIYEGVGAGHGVDKDLGQAHESAIKEAESDAQKRALRHLGNQFGLALYDKEQRNVTNEPAPPDRPKLLKSAHAGEDYVGGGPDYRLKHLRCETLEEASDDELVAYIAQMRKDAAAAPTAETTA